MCTGLHDQLTITCQHNAFWHRQTTFRRTSTTCLFQPNSNRNHTKMAACIFNEFVQEPYRGQMLPEPGTVKRLITVQLLICLFSLRLLSAWSLCNCSFIWSNLASFHLCNLASELIIQPKLLSVHCFLIFTLLWINLMLHALHYSMLRRRLIWWIMKSCCNVLRLPSDFLALLFIGFARAFLVALRWWYWVTLALLGFLSNLASLRALFWVLSSASYSHLIFLVYLLNNLPLATSVLTTSWLMSIVLLLNSLILLHLLHLLLLILILGCLLIVCHLILPRPN